MPLFLADRNTALRERMDDPDCDLSALFNTYRQFGTVNSLIGRWKYIYRNMIRPVLRETGGNGRLLDIGFGGGDIPLKLAQWTAEDDIDLEITGIDPDPRANRYVRRLDCPDNVTFRQASSANLVRENQTFDIVISNHLLHHLEKQEFYRLADEAVQLSRKGVYFNDIERSDIAYLAFALLSGPLFRSSFITHDGLASIRRSYTRRELSILAPPGWNVKRLFPYRVLLYYTHD